MALQSTILAGNARLEQAAAGGPSVKKAPPADDPDAVRRLQRALVALGFPLPKSFPLGASGEPDGKFGDETFTQLQKFQKQAFPNQFSEWDGRAGKNTLAAMDARLPRKAAPAPPTPPPGPAPLSMSALAERDKQVSLLWALAAIRHLRAVRAFLEPSKGKVNPGNFQQPHIRLTLEALEVHYNFSKTLEPPLAYLDHLILIYINTALVLANSQLFFVDDTATDEAKKGVPAHVPFGGGKVFFTPAFQEFQVTTGRGFGPLCRAAMVLHEPVHIVDHPLASTVPTHVHENSPQYATNPPEHQKHNAHSYACFGQHVFFGSDTRFGIGKHFL